MNTTIRISVTPTMLKYILENAGGNSIVGEEMELALEAVETYIDDSQEEIKSLNEKLRAAQIKLEAARDTGKPFLKSSSEAVAVASAIVSEDWRAGWEACRAHATAAAVHNTAIRSALTVISTTEAPPPPNSDADAHLESIAEFRAQLVANVEALSG